MRIRTAAHLFSTLQAIEVVLFKSTALNARKLMQEIALNGLSSNCFRMIHICFYNQCILGQPALLPPPLNHFP